MAPTPFLAMLLLQSPLPVVVKVRMGEQILLALVVQGVVELRLAHQGQALVAQVTRQLLALHKEAMAVMAAPEHLETLALAVVEVHQPSGLMLLE
jgi:hypothetical protein